MIESSSGEEEDEEKEYDKYEMTPFIKKFNKYISKRRAFKGDKKEKTRSKMVCYNCDNNTNKKKDKSYKKDKSGT
jgi:hypothetical protein